MDGLHLSPDPAAGDESTVGGYAAVHGRPAAFEGPDGFAYSVEPSADETGEPGVPWGGYFLFLRWKRVGASGIDGHLESDFVVDTPGLREVGLWGLPVERLDACFPEFRPYLDECRFADCAHGTEPDCAVRGAVEAGRVSAERYESYRKLRQEAEEGTPPEWA